MQNADYLDAAILYDRDFEYDYFGFKTLEESYSMVRSASSPRRHQAGRSARRRVRRRVRRRAGRHAMPAQTKAGRARRRSSGPAPPPIARLQAASSSTHAPSPPPLQLVLSSAVRQGRRASPAHADACLDRHPQARPREGRRDVPSDGDRWFAHATPTMFNAGTVGTVVVLSMKEDSIAASSRRSSSAP